MQTRENPDIHNNYIFRQAKLRIVFAMIKVLGKYIENSGLDRLYIETGIYGGTTLGQIINSKHMKRYLEAHTSMYISLIEILFRHWSVEVALTSQDTERISVILAIINNTPYENETDFCQQTDKLYEFIDSIKLTEKLDAFALSLTMKGES